MLQVITSWFHRYFSDPQAVLLAILLLLSFTVIYTLGSMLAPVLAALVMAYLLEGLVKNLTRRRVPRWIAVQIVFLGFMTLVLFMLFVLLPLLSHQASQLFQELPVMLNRGQQLLMQLPERYPQYVSADQIHNIIQSVRDGTKNMGQAVLSYSLASIPALITLMVYLILVPLLIFFFLKDKSLLVAWFESFLPDERSIAKHLWAEMDWQIGNYVRGKVYEILIVGAVSHVAFTLMGLNYAPLLAALVGLSVIVPYLGAAVVTVPVLIVAYFQWGWSSDFLWIVLVYSVIQALDGNVLVPLLFSEAVNLHPVAIIVAVLVFGGLWGFWGVFFAIPLATLVKALITSWPRVEDEENLSPAIAEK